MKAANWAALAVAFAMSVLPQNAAQAQERETLGWGTIFSNDYLGDGKDRWLTGSYTVSMLRGADWQGQLTSGFGDVVEYRMRTQIYAPESLLVPKGAPQDRRYTGMVALGAHSHFARGILDYSLGGDMVFVGPQTGLADFQESTHEIFGASDPSVAADDQLENGVFPTALASATVPLRWGEKLESRAFVEAQAGVETMVRMGSDLIIGGIGEGNLLIRDPATGHLYEGVHGGASGANLVLGGDIAFVSDSHLLPSDDGYELTDYRARLRAGVNWQGEKLGLFYGVTWMTEEFTQQRQEQLLGTVNLRLNF